MKTLQGKGLLCIRDRQRIGNISLALKCVGHVQATGEGLSLRTLQEDRFSAQALSCAYTETHLRSTFCA